MQIPRMHPDMDTSFICMYILAGMQKSGFTGNITIDCCGMGLMR